MYRINSMFRFYIILSIILIIFTNSINAENITKIHVLGNERVSDKTIILFSELDTDISVDSLTINNAIQKLYETNFFQDINISFNEGVLKIEVVENPIVQSIIINGIKKKNIKE